MSKKDFPCENRHHLDTIHLNKIRAGSPLCKLRECEEAILNNIASSLETAQLILDRRVWAGLPQFPVKLLPEFVLGRNDTCVCNNKGEVLKAIKSKLLLSSTSTVQFVFED